MSGIINKILQFMNGEQEELEEMTEEKDNQNTTDEDSVYVYEPKSNDYFFGKSKKNENKIVNLHAASHIKVVIVSPSDFDDAQEICDHLKNKKPVIVNLEELEKNCAQRIIDFLSGSLYALDGTIQKVSGAIYLAAPCNVDVLNELKNDFKTKNIFSWAK